jgi:HrpA-like RNA helicase
MTTVYACMITNCVQTIQTGCGKSSKVPLMLMEGGAVAGSGGKRPKMFVSQPRRIAAKALMDRYTCSTNTE